jgi:hypothetical protein
MKHQEPLWLPQPDPFLQIGSSKHCQLYSSSVGIVGFLCGEADDAGRDGGWPEICALNDACICVTSALDKEFGNRHFVQ